MREKRAEDVSCQYAFHHFRDKAGMLREAFRVLRRGGRFALYNMCPQESDDWLYYAYFPEAKIRDFADFWPPDAIPQSAEALVGDRDERYGSAKSGRARRVRTACRRRGDPKRSSTICCRFFRRHAELGSVRLLKDELEARRPRRVNSGRMSSGRNRDRGAIVWPLPKRCWWARKKAT